MKSQVNNRYNNRHNWDSKLLTGKESNSKGDMGIGKGRPVSQQ